MNETSPDTDHDDGEQIDVDLDAADATKAVIRTRNTVKPAKAGKDKELEFNNWADRSKKVQRRINTMQRTFDQQRAEDQALHQRELADLRSRLDGLTRTDPTGNTDEQAHERAMDALQAKLEEAQERGDSKEVAALTRQMSQLDGKFWAAQTAKQTGATAAADKGNGKDTRPAAVTTQQGPKPTKAGIAWAKANTDWWDDKDDEIAVSARAAANGIYAKLLADGEDPQLPEFYERIRKQIAKRFPELDVVSTLTHESGERDEDDDPDRRHRDPVRRAASLQMPNRGEPAPRNSRSQTLTGADQRTMKSVGLDPSKNSHVIEFLKSKNDLEANA